MKGAAGPEGLETRVPWEGVQAGEARTAGLVFCDLPSRGAIRLGDTSGDPLSWGARPFFEGKPSLPEVLLENDWARAGSGGPASPSSYSLSTLAASTSFLFRCERAPRIRAKNHHDFQDTTDQLVLEGYLVDLVESDGCHLSPLQRANANSAPNRNRRCLWVNSSLSTRLRKIRSRKRFTRLTVSSPDRGESREAR